MVIPFYPVGAFLAGLFLGMIFGAFAVALRVVDRMVDRVEDSVLPGLVSGFRGWSTEPIPLPPVSGRAERPGGPRAPEDDETPVIEDLPSPDR
jgi:hypothetical protein